MAGNEDMEISLDKLPIKRLEHIEESGVERFPPEVGYEEKTVNLIRRIDFAWALERDTKKPKKAKEASGPSAWQGLIENLHLAHQELSVIIDLINTVEANDQVAVAGMNRPKPLPNEVLSDLAVSAATKLQCYRHLSKYFKQSAKALEEQIGRESRFYGALIRLQQNWKIKRHRMAASAPGSEGFLIDLSDISAHYQPAGIRPSACAMVRVDHDSSGMLAVNIPKNSLRSFQFGFPDVHADDGPEKHGDRNFGTAKESKEARKDSASDDDRIQETHTLLRDAHRAIFYEQVFELVSRESFNPSSGVNVTGLRENYLEMSIKPGALVFISLESSKQGDQDTPDSKDTPNEDDISNGAGLVESGQDAKIKFGLPNHVTYQIYLQQLFHDEIFGKTKERMALPNKTPSSQPPKDDVGLVSHFCSSLAHRIFSTEVLRELEKLVTKIPYLELITQPTWHSRSSSWTLNAKVPDSMQNSRSQASRSDEHQSKDIPKPLFQTRVVVKDDCITIEGGGTPNAFGLSKGNLEVVGSKNRFNCDLVDLPVVLLLQVASKIIDWLHEEALMVGIKTTRDFLSLCLELDQGETLSLVAHVDQDDALGCISWWLTLEDGFTKERRLQVDLPEDESGSRRFLGYLSLDELYSTLMDLVSLSTGSANC